MGDLEGGNGIVLSEHSAATLVVNSQVSNGTGRISVNGYTDTKTLIAGKQAHRQQAEASLLRHSIGLA